MEFVEVQIGDNLHMLTLDEARQLRDDLNVQLAARSDSIGREQFNTFFDESDQYRAGRLWGVLTRHDSPFRLSSGLISRTAIIQRTDEFQGVHHRGMGPGTTMLLYQFRELLLVVR